MKMTTEELQTLLRAHKWAHEAPVMAMSVADGLSGNDFSSTAHKSFVALWIEVCGKYGLDPNETGFNRETGEFVS